MAILSECFKQTAQQLAEQNTAGIQLIDDIEDLLEPFHLNGHCHKRVVIRKTCAIISLLRDLKRFVQLKVDFFKRMAFIISKKVGEREIVW